MRVSIRPATEQDIPTLVEHQSDAIAQAMAAFIASATAEERSARWRDILAGSGNCVWAIVSDDVVIGSAGSFTRGDEREVTYWIARDHWGRGVATQALSLLLAEETVRPLYARVAADNIGSQAVL